MAFGMAPYIFAFAEDFSWEVEDFLDTEPTTSDYLFIPVPATAGQTFYVEVYHLFEEADTGIYRISAGTRLASEQVSSATTDAKTQAGLRLFLPLVAR